MNDLLPVVVLRGKRLLVHSPASSSTALVDADNPGGVSYAHMFDDGRILRFREEIGRGEELECTGETQRFSAADALEGILAMLDLSANSP